MNNPPSRLAGLYLTVFLAGAAVLTLEIVATRILSPHFGMTLFTVSSILSVVLGGLSLGYWVGGRIADRSPRPQTLATAVLSAGVTTLSIRLFDAVHLSNRRLLLDIMAGPLISSLTMFFLPAFFLGMVSPMAIRLTLTNRKTAGEQAGKIFFFGTLGSIVGSLATGFFLIPRVPISGIVIGTSAVLISLGVLGLRRSLSRRAWLILGVALAAALIARVRLQLQGDPRIIYEEDTPYQHVRVLQEQVPEGKVRLLLLDRSYAGAGYTDSAELPFPYTRYWRLYELVNEDARRFLYLGGGAYTTPKKLLADRDDPIEVDVVEIDPRLPAIASSFFGLPVDPRLTLIIEDARVFLAQTPDRYDMIMIDVFSQDIGIPAHLMTQEFYKLVRDHLTEQGTVIMNVAANIDPDPPSLGLAALKTFQLVFPSSEFIALNPQDLSAIQNIIFWGIRDDTWSFDPNHPRMLYASEEELRTLEGHRLDTRRLDLSRQPILSDDYAPVEYLVAKMIKKAL